MAATIAYLMEWHWHVDQLHRWTRPGTNLMLEGEMSIQDPWWKLERALLTEAKAQRTARLANREHHQHLLAGIDWHTYRRMRRWQTQALSHLPGPGYAEAHLTVAQVASNSTTQAHAARMGRANSLSGGNTSLECRLDST